MHTKHTKCKLHINQKSQICTDNWVFCVDAYIACPNHELGVGNARRLVATWNACDGISTEDLEAGCVQKLVEAAKAMFDTPMDGLQRFRDLRDALAPFLQTEKPAGEGGPGG